MELVKEFLNAQIQNTSFSLEDHRIQPSIFLVDERVPTPILTAILFTVQRQDRSFSDGVFQSAVTALK